MNHEPMWVDIARKPGIIPAIAPEALSTVCAVCGLNKAYHEKYRNPGLEDGFEDDLNFSGTQFLFGSIL